MKKIFFINICLIVLCLPSVSQSSEQDLNREVTLYNPYKPSLHEAKKRSFLPDINDTSKIRPDFSYSINPKAYNPVYSISPIKAASLLPDPLTKLYKSYINLGFGNYVTPLAEISITNERSKKGSIGLYARHFSTNGKIRLDDEKKAFAGYMDNDAALSGKKFFRKNYMEGSVNFLQRNRYAYGYDTRITGYSPEKKDIKLGYNNIVAKASFSSLNLDSTELSYDFSIHYDFFFTGRESYQNNPGLSGRISKIYKDFYAGSDIEFDYFSFSDIISESPKYYASINPFVRKSTAQWNFNLGMRMLLEKIPERSAKLHLYPDVRFGFNIVPSYVSFFTALNGRLEKNDPLKIIDENPFIVKDGSLFRLPNTSHALIVSAGLKGNTGMEGSYLLSTSYSVINDLLLYSNFVFPDSVGAPQMGNLFLPLTDDVELLTIHGEMTGMIGEKIYYSGMANIYNYSLTLSEYALNKPSWDATFGVKYNLRNKIIAGLDMEATGKRWFMATERDNTPSPDNRNYFDQPGNINLNLSAEYRYTKILSFWFRLNNISFGKYYEWGYYPARRFIGLVGFTYSL